MVTYSSGSCLVSGAVLTGWEVKTPSANRGHRWGCLHCFRNWDREHIAAEDANLVMDGQFCSFYSYWPLSEYVKTNCPEVYHKTLESRRLYILCGFRSALPRGQGARVTAGGFA